jgi:hypothetical protein
MKLTASHFDLTGALWIVATGTAVSGVIPVLRMREPQFSRFTGKAGYECVVHLSEEGGCDDSR